METQPYFDCAVCTTNLQTNEKTCSNVQAQWRFFYVNCPKISFNCNAGSGAYVPAITVCNQRLFF